MIPPKSGGFQPPMPSDTIHCTGLKLQVHIGFHDYERHIKQAIRVDLALETDFRRGPGADKRDGLIDYSVVVREIETHVQGKQYDLVEALAVDIARQIVTQHRDVVAHVRVTKVPLDMPSVDSIAAECVRSVADFEVAP